MLSIHYLYRSTPKHVNVPSTVEVNIRRMLETCHRHELVFLAEARPEGEQER